MTRTMPAMQPTIPTRPFDAGESNETRRNEVNA